MPDPTPPAPSPLPPRRLLLSPQAWTQLRDLQHQAPRKPLTGLLIGHHWPDTTLVTHVQPFRADLASPHIRRILRHSFDFYFGWITGVRTALPLSGTTQVGWWILQEDSVDLDEPLKPEEITSLLSQQRWELPSGQPDLDDLHINLDVGFQNATLKVRAVQITKSTQQQQVMDVH
ncbi:hypothetical protein GCM10008956_30170 [Deinococcus arenae]|jgi:hypothetical protein|uniref:Uncharacterized protein n=1 Tax=Deinococcus arenae TaxID=1452751 RepID=A0A8H9GUB0_9DEIO|nr:hypothetical protein [Deinococcus arenae]GGM52057.1 hypothetical protein GCM10008956_30170 [Deinococcus arenae]